MPRRRLPGFLRHVRVLAQQVKHVLDGYHVPAALDVGAEHPHSTFTLPVRPPPLLQFRNGHLDPGAAGPPQGSHRVMPLGTGLAGLMVPAKTPLR